MKRIHYVSMCAIMALMIATNSHARSPIMRVETSRVMVENFTVDRQSLPQDIIGFYNAYDIDWEFKMGRAIILSLQDAVGHFIMDEKYNDGEDIASALMRETGATQSLPVPHHIHDAFYSSTNFDWLFKKGMNNFYFNLTRVKLVDGMYGSCVVVRKEFTGWQGATSHVYHYYMIYNINEGKELPASSIFMKGAENRVIDAILSEMMTKYQAHDFKDLCNKICIMDDTKLPPLPKNIGFENGEFIFVYNPYEITCGSADNIIVKVPAATLRTALTSEASQALGL